MIRISNNDNNSALSSFYNFASIMLSVERSEINKLEDIDIDFLLQKETWQQYAGHLMRMAVNTTITVNTAEVYFNASKLAVKTRIFVV